MKKRVSFPIALLRSKLMTNGVSLGLIPRSLLRGVSLNTTVYLAVGAGLTIGRCISIRGYTHVETLVYIGGIF